MALEMVLNEHSLCAPDVDRARVWMTELAETIQQISQICGGQAAKFWTQKQVGSTLLTRDYRDRDYALRTYLFGDQTVKNNKKQKAQRDYLQSLLTRTPYWMNSLNREHLSIQTLTKWSSFTIIRRVQCVD